MCVNEMCIFNKEKLIRNGLPHVFVYVHVIIDVWCLLQM